jgi:hypothetical protein
MVKEMLEALMREEREICLEEHPTKANGYYTRDLLTLVGPLEDLKAPGPVPATFTPRTNWSSWPKARLKSTAKNSQRRDPQQRILRSGNMFLASKRYV